MAAIALDQTLERIVQHRSKLTLGKVLLTLVAAIPWLIGWVLGLLWVGVTLLWAAGAVGMSQARASMERRSDSG